MLNSHIKNLGFGVPNQIISPVGKFSKKEAKQPGQPGQHGQVRQHNFIRLG